MPAEFDKLRLAIKRQLKKDNPKMSEDELKTRSFAVATAQWKKTHDGKVPSESIKTEEKTDVKYDELGREIIGENVKFYIEGGINTITE